MTDFLKTRLYIHVHSRSFKVFIAFSAAWCIGFLLTILGAGPDLKPVSSAYGLWCFMEFYLSAMPVAIAYWYGDLISSRFVDNIPFRFDHKLSLSGLFFTLLMNLFCAAGFLIYGNILFLIPNKSIVFYNDPLTMLTLSIVLFVGSFARCMIVIFLIELLKSRIWGALFGFMCIAGLSFELILSLEAIALAAAGVRSSSFPLANSTSYMMVEALMPGLKDEDQWVVRELHADVSTILLRMVLYFAVILIITIILIRRKDKE